MKGADGGESGLNTVAAVENDRIDSGHIGFALAVEVDT